MPGGHPSALVIKFARVIAVLFRAPYGTHLIKPAASKDLTGKLTTSRPIRLPPGTAALTGTGDRGREFHGGANPACPDPRGKAAENTMGEFRQHYQLDISS